VLLGMCGGGWASEFRIPVLRSALVPFPLILLS
jgi:hypothetical protein